MTEIKLKPHRPIKRLAIRNWSVKPSVALLAGMAVAASSLFLGIWRLSFLTVQRANAHELATKQLLYLNSPWWKSPTHLYGPYYLLLHATFSINHSLSAFRLAAVICGVISCLMVYWLTNHWHGYKIGLLASAAFMTSFGYLVVSRQATLLAPQILLVISMVLAVAIMRTWDGFWAMTTTIAIYAAALYLPGGIWLALVAFLLSIKDIQSSWRQFKRQQKVIIALLGLALIGPLIYRFTASFSLALLANWLGYNLGGGLNAIKHFLINFYRTPLDLFVRTQALSSNIALGHLPLIPIAESIIITVGIYCYLKNLRNANWRTVSVLLGSSWLVICLGRLSVFALLPLLALAFAAGLAYLLKQWYVVFPRNPIARGTGLSVIVLVVLFSCFFGVRSYFVAWGNDPSVIARFSHQLH